MKKKAMVPGFAELSKHFISILQPNHICAAFGFIAPATKVGMSGGKNDLLKYTDWLILNGYTIVEITYKKGYR